MIERFNSHIRAVVFFTGEEEVAEVSWLTAAELAGELGRIDGLAEAEEMFLEEWVVGLVGWAPAIRQQPPTGVREFLRPRRGRGGGPGVYWKVTHRPFARTCHHTGRFKCLLISKVYLNKVLGSQRLNN